MITLRLYARTAVFGSLLAAALGCTDPSDDRGAVAGDGPVGDRDADDAGKMDSEAAAARSVTRTDAGKPAGENDKHDSATNNAADGGAPTSHDAGANAADGGDRQPPSASAVLPQLERDF